jgi:DNA segregation ATPase FtsK/SpoIIIE-like protein
MTHHNDVPISPIWEQALEGQHVPIDVNPATPAGGSINRAELERQADAIEMVLSTNHAPAQCTGGHVTHRAISFQLSPAANGRKVAALTNEIARALGVTQDAITVSTGGGAARIDIRRADPQPVALPMMLKRIPAEKVPPLTALLGLADDGAPLLIRLPSQEVGGHMLITGGASSGKTSLLTTSILSLAHYNQPRALQCVLIGRTLRNLARLPHTLDRTLPDLVQLLARRDEHTQPAIVVAIDDFDELSAVDQQAAQQLIARGAPARVLVIGTTRSDDHHWPTMITARAGQAADAFLVKATTSAAMSFTAAYADERAIDHLIAGLR